MPAFFILSLFFVYSARAVEPVRVDRGDSLTNIAQHLKSAGIIRSTGLFKIYSFVTGAAHRFRPGIYSFTGQESLSKIIGTLTTGPGLVEVVIPEGLTLKDIDAKLYQLGITKKGDLVNYRSAASLEGFLFPDTYKFTPGTEIAVIVKTMRDNFDGKTKTLLSNRSDWYTILTLASLLEKEVPTLQDQLLVADILQRRLKMGMPLQVDATITYLKCDGEYFVCGDRQLTKADFKIDSPYNTYLNKGLPPTPIANPGVAAISAVLHPKKNSYLFYLTDPKTKKTIFSKDFDGHVDNKFKYLK